MIAFLLPISAPQELTMCSLAAHLEPAATAVQRWYKFALERSYYKLFPLKHAFIFDCTVFLLRKLGKKKLFQNNFI